MGSWGNQLSFQNSELDDRGYRGNTVLLFLLLWAQHEESHFNSDLSAGDIFSQTLVFKLL